MKFRKSPHWTEKSLRHAQKPANPRSANPCGPESTSVTPGKDPPMATPPQGRKMAPERPFPILIETGKSYSKTGLFQRFSGGFPGKFDGGFPAVYRGFPGGLRRFSSGFLGKFDAGFAGGFPAVFRRFSRQVQRRFPGGFLRQVPAVFQRFCQRFSRQVRRRFDSHFPATRFPWINPQPAPAPPLHPKETVGQFRTHFHAYKPSIAAFSKVCL